MRGHQWGLRGGQWKGRAERKAQGGVGGTMILEESPRMRAFDCEWERVGGYYPSATRGGGAEASSAAHGTHAANGWRSGVCQPVAAVGGRLLLTNGGGDFLVNLG